MNNNKKREALHSMQTKEVQMQKEVARNFQFNSNL